MDRKWKEKGGEEGERRVQKMSERMAACAWIVVQAKVDTGGECDSNANVDGSDTYCILRTILMISILPLSHCCSQALIYAKTRWRTCLFPVLPKHIFYDRILYRWDGGLREG